MDCDRSGVLASESGGSPLRGLRLTFHQGCYSDAQHFRPVLHRIDTRVAPVHPTEVERLLRRAATLMVAPLPRRRRMGRVRGMANHACGADGLLLCSGDCPMHVSTQPGAGAECHADSGGQLLRGV